MNAPSKSRAGTPKLDLVHTELGFDLLISAADYLSVLLIRDGIFEAPETDLVTRILRPGDVCIDAGCHVGYYSCLSAKIVGEKGKVYSFDPNPHACDSTRRNLALNGLYSTEVIQTALTDQGGARPFYLSSDDQTGLSSLAPIPVYKEVISVPCLRLDEFLQNRQIKKIRLLKLDVEGAEEMVLKGLGRYLSEPAIDFILVECFDERLQMLDTCCANIAGVLKSAGYRCWEFGTTSPAGWSPTTDVRSRGDCNYLFSSPSVTELLPSISLNAVLAQTQVQNGQLRDKNAALKQSLEKVQDQLRSENAALKQSLEKVQDDNDWLLSSIANHEQQKREFEILWEKVETSAGWRTLNYWRNLRNRMAGEKTWLRQVYDRMLGPLRG